MWLVPRGADDWTLTLGSVVVAIFLFVGMGVTAYYVLRSILWLCRLVMLPGDVERLDQKKADDLLLEWLKKQEYVFWWELHEERDSRWPDLSPDECIAERVRWAQERLAERLPKRLRQLPPERVKQPAWH